MAAKPMTTQLQADLLKQGATLYVIPLANMDTTGLKVVASAPNEPYFSEARGAEELLANIQAIVVR